MREVLGTFNGVDLDEKTITIGDMLFNEASYVLRSIAARTKVGQTLMVGIENDRIMWFRPMDMRDVAHTPDFVREKLAELLSIIQKSLDANITDTGSAMIASTIGLLVDVQIAMVEEAEQINNNLESIANELKMLRQGRKL